MSILDKSRKLLWGQSGNRCAVCKCELVEFARTDDRKAIIGVECHIHAQKAGGPRYNPLFPASQLHDYSNLIILCSKCHKVIDDQPLVYTPEKIYDIKNRHIEYVRDATKPLEKRYPREVEAVTVSKGLDLVEREIGIRWSHRADIPVQVEVIRFRGRLIAEAQEEYCKFIRWYELFQLSNGYYVVYTETVRSMDYSEAYLFGANAWGEESSPLTLERVQTKFPLLATKAGLPRVRDFDPT